MKLSEHYSKRRELHSNFLGSGQSLLEDALVVQRNKYVVAAVVDVLFDQTTGSDPFSEPA